MEPMFQIGDKITTPTGLQGEVIKVTDTYIIIDIVDGNPIKKMLTDFTTSNLTRV